MITDSALLSQDEHEVAKKAKMRSISKIIFFGLRAIRPTSSLRDLLDLRESLSVRSGQRRAFSRLRLSTGAGGDLLSQDGHEVTKRAKRRSLFKDYFLQAFVFFVPLRFFVIK